MNNQEKKQQKLEALNTELFRIGKLTENKKTSFESRIPLYARMQQLIIEIYYLEQSIAGVSRREADKCLNELFQARQISFVLGALS